MHTFKPRLETLPAAQRELLPRLEPLAAAGVCALFILQRSEAKDYQDIAALIRAGARVDEALAAAEQMFKPTFPPAESLKAMVYFEGGDLERLSAADRLVLAEAARRVGRLPAVAIEPGLMPPETPAR